MLRELSFYIFWPFGKFVERDEEWHDNTPNHEQQQQTDYFSSRDSIMNDMGIEDERRPLLGRHLYIRNSTFTRPRSEKFNFFEKLDEIGPAGVFFYFWFFLILGEFF